MWLVLSGLRFCFFVSYLAACLYVFCCFFYACRPCCWALQVLQFILHACLAFGALRVFILACLSACTLLLPGALQLPACHMFYFVEVPALAIEALQLPVCDLFHFVGDAAIFKNAIKALQLPVCGSCCCLPGFVLLEFCVFELIL